MKWKFSKKMFKIYHDCDEYAVTYVKFYHWHIFIFFKLRRNVPNATIGEVASHPLNLTLLFWTPLAHFGIYRDITSKRSPFGYEAPSCPHPRPDCAKTIYEKLPKR